MASKQKIDVVTNEFVTKQVHEEAILAKDMKIHQLLAIINGKEAELELWKARNGELVGYIQALLRLSSDAILDHHD